MRLKHKNIAYAVALEVLILRGKNDNRCTIVVPVLNTLRILDFEDVKTLLEVYMSIVKVFVG